MIQRSLIYCVTASVTVFSYLRYFSQLSARQPNKGIGASFDAPDAPPTLTESGPIDAPDGAGHRDVTFKSWHHDDVMLISF